MGARTISPNAADAIFRLGRDIQTARRKRRLRQKDLAARMGVAVGTVQNLEKGDQGVSIGVLAMAFVALGSLHRFTEALDVASDDVGLLHDQATLPKRVRRRGTPRGEKTRLQPLSQGKRIGL